HFGPKMTLSDPFSVLFNNCAAVTHLSVAVISPARFRLFPSGSKNIFININPPIYYQKPPPT
ncbi:hypothetical protein, partial [Escherichia coli]|uniref:hypothetical protein n=1 Tax=Escherichia coli TaxID=562 RepID=UPI001BFC7616